MKLPKHYYSWTTVIGGAIALIAFFMIVILFLVTLVFGDGDNYSGLFTFIILPAVMLMGIGLALIGKLVNMRRKKRHADEEIAYPVVDFNDPKQRSVITPNQMSFVVPSVILLWSLSMSHIRDQRMHGFSVLSAMLVREQAGMSNRNYPDCIRFIR